MGCPHGKCVLWRKPSPQRAGDLLRLGLSALALRMYFGVSDQLHLLPQKQVWSRPRVLQPQGKSILTLHSPSSPWAGQGHWHRYRQSRLGGADNGNVALMPGEVQIL